MLPEPPPGRRSDKVRHRRQLRHDSACDSKIVYITVPIVARWLTEPSSRDFDLNALAVITGMTGQEWPATRSLVDMGNPG